MPGPLVVPLIAAGASVAGDAIGAITGSAAAKKQRKFAREMYARQRADALSDYHMQNEYNSPKSQMARYRDAGLNENLIYGQATNSPAARIDAPSYSESASATHKPDIRSGGQIGNSLLQYYDIKLREAQTDNLTKQNSVLTEDAALRRAQTLATLAQADLSKVNTDMSRFDLNLKGTLRDNSVEIAEQQLERLKAETQSTLTNTETQMIMRAPNFIKAIEDILTSRANRATNEVQREYIRKQIDVLKKDEQLKQLDINLKKLGIQPSDNIAARIVAQLLNKLGVSQGQPWLQQNEDKPGSFKLNPFPIIPRWLHP